MNALVKDPTVWIDVGAVSDVPLRGARRLPAPGGAIAVFRTGDGQVFALRDACPHKGGPLSQGIVHGHAVACPLHNWSIDLATGEPLGADRGKGCSPVVPLRIEDGRILLAEG
jgi:nitrite reductase (NADH) small subunit